MPVPDWVQDAIFYQIFPDRFRNGDPLNDPSNVHPWGAKPTIWHYQGGDLAGIIHSLDYLLDLGVTAIYLNPIFESTANHRYHTTDYFKIDPRLGGMDTFKRLLETAHQNGLRVILDGVFNHSGRGFFAFSDVLENGGNSAYQDWYHIDRFPLNAFTSGRAKNYEAWWAIKALPKFNTDNPEVRQFLFSVARYWVEQGIDGWRLDVPAEIDDDGFWSEFRGAVKTANPEAYIVGEHWTYDSRWVGDNHFDGLMNYPFRDAVLAMLRAEIHLHEFTERIETAIKVYPVEHLNAMYVPLGSHDTTRLLTKVGGDVNKARLALLMQFAYPGAPAVYYGDEIGMQGGKDPDNRCAFQWDESEWNIEIRDWVRRLITVRKASPALRRGVYQRLLVNETKSVFAFTRAVERETVLVAFNLSPDTQDIEIPLDWGEGSILEDMLAGREVRVSGGKARLHLPAWGGVLLRPKN
jgi:glycosidase